MIVMSPRYLLSSWCKDDLMVSARGLDGAVSPIRVRSLWSGRSRERRRLARFSARQSAAIRRWGSASTTRKAACRMVGGNVRENSDDYVRQLWSLQQR